MSLRASHWQPIPVVWALPTHRPVCLPPDFGHPNLNEILHKVGGSKDWNRTIRPNRSTIRKELQT